ncbi:Hypothetical predicted protein [Lecanosticta acicola]|uniref:Uncharacterized protein n=1 Tax=Lecanosticta acicola TaxID=111012 RepID=A0AAI9E701_9PEZI|nr:Hypothetical predicted protein [Lecanosticta acicola]
MDCHKQREAHATRENKKAGLFLSFCFNCFRRHRQHPRRRQHTHLPIRYPPWSPSPTHNTTSVTTPSSPPTPPNPRQNPRVPPGGFLSEPNNWPVAAKGFKLYTWEHGFRPPRADPKTGISPHPKSVDDVWKMGPAQLPKLQEEDTWEHEAGMMKIDMWRETWEHLLDPKSKCTVRDGWCVNAACRPGWKLQRPSDHPVYQKKDDGEGSDSGNKKKPAPSRGRKRGAAAMASGETPAKKTKTATSTKSTASKRKEAEAGKGKGKEAIVSGQEIDPRDTGSL